MTKIPTKTSGKQPPTKPNPKETSRRTSGTPGNGMGWFFVGAFVLLTLINFLAPPKKSPNPFDPNIKREASKAVERAQLEADRNGYELTDEQAGKIYDQRFLEEYRKQK